MYLGGEPDWWCLETPWPPIGPDVAGYINAIPAQRRFEGLPCSTAPEVHLSAVPGDETVYLSWEANITLPATATWDISYIGPPGDQPSPITGLPQLTRAYLLTGLTNYTSYSITLKAMDGGAILLTDTVTVMPTDNITYLPAINH
jgi:hypothetical protein